MPPPLLRSAVATPVAAVGRFAAMLAFGSPLSVVIGGATGSPRSWRRFCMYDQRSLSTGGFGRGGAGTGGAGTGGVGTVGAALVDAITAGGGTRRAGGGGERVGGLGSAKFGRWGSGAGGGVGMAASFTCRRSFATSGPSSKGARSLVRSRTRKSAAT